MEYKKRRTGVKDNKPIFSISLEMNSLNELELLIGVYGKEFLNKHDDEGNTIFHRVCIDDDVNTIKYLHQKYGLSLTLMNYREDSVFDVMCLSGSEQCFNYILEFPKYVDGIKNYLNLNNFRSIVKTCSMQFIKKFIDVFKDTILSLKDSYAQNVLMCILEYTSTLSEKHKENIRFSFKYIVENTNIRVDYMNANKCTVIEHLLEQGFVELLEYLVESGKKLDWKYRSESGIRTLEYFFNRKSIEYVLFGTENGNFSRMVNMLCKFLISYPEIKRVLLGDDITIYHFLVKIQKTEYIPLINNHFYEELNMKNSSGETVLTELCRYSSEMVVLNLMKNENLDVNVQNNEGNTAVMVACINKIPGMVKTIINNKYHKINANIKNKEGDTVLMLACKSGVFEDAVVILEYAKYLIDIDAQNNNGDTVLSLACSKGNMSFIRRILNLPGSIKNVQNKDGETPVTMALKNGHYLTANLLLTCMRPLLYNLNEQETCRFIERMSNEGVVCITTKEIMHKTGPNFLNFKSIYNFCSKKRLEEEDFSEYMSEKNKQRCCVCLDNKCDIIFKPCEHLCCSKCVVGLLKYNKNLICHSCRETINTVIKIS